MVEVGDIFREYGNEYRKTHEVPYKIYKVMHAVEMCRTSELGGHVDKCDCCGHIRISYNSCRNRHCPKCQGLKSEKWIQERKEDLLPVGYFHIVFTIPEELNLLVLINQRVMYEVLFKSVSETLIELSKDPKHLGAEIGFIAVLHTWGQNLLNHPHIHCIVPGGGLSLNEKWWVTSRKKFFIPVKILSDLFKKKFRAYMKEEYYKGKLKFIGEIEKLKEVSKFERFAKEVIERNWVVYSKPPFGNAEKVIEYLGRYINRVAISNSRIIKAEDRKVTFKWRDYKDKNKEKLMTLDVFEFMRRFLLHVLPKNFVKIRHYGILSSRNKKIKLKKCREVLGIYKKKDIKKGNRKKGFEEILKEIKGIDYKKCPICNEGRMIQIKEIEKGVYRPPDNTIENHNIA